MATGREITRDKSLQTGEERVFMGKLKVSVDQDKCIAGGECAFAVPEVFDQREEDGVVVLLTDEPDESLHDAVLDAARFCPALAIKVEVVED
jgi:ferredoxin